MFKDYYDIEKNKYIVNEEEFIALIPLIQNIDLIFQYHIWI